MAVVTAVPHTHAPVLVIIPTHEHAVTLPLSVGSVLNQTWFDLEIVIIGDGATGDVEEAARALARGDRRVHYWSREKGVSRGEGARHAVIRSSQAQFVTYLGDDDLFLPDHVALTTSELAQVEFTHPYPTFTHVDNSISVMPTDLTRLDCRAWHLEEDHNAISLSGASHTMALYERLPAGWRPPPAGTWSDHYMWQQILSLPDMRASTMERSTTIKIHQSEFAGGGDELRLTTLSDWFQRIQQPGFSDRWQVMVRGALARYAVESLIERTSLEESLEDVRDTLARASAGDHERGRGQQSRAELSGWMERAHAAEAQLAESRRPTQQLKGLLRTVPAAVRARFPIGRG